MMQEPLYNNGKQATRYGPRFVIMKATLYGKKHTKTLQLWKHTNNDNIEMIITSSYKNVIERLWLRTSPRLEQVKKNLTWTTL